MELQKTIKEAIVLTLKKQNKPLSASEFYDFIHSNNLFVFKSTNPKAIISSELRKRCAGLNLKKAYPQKLFKKDVENRYSLV